MTVFIKRPPVTCSNCYETMKKDSVLMELGTNVDSTIALVTAYSIFNFLLTWQRGNVSKLHKLHNFHCFFRQNWFNGLRNWERVKSFSALVTRYLTIDLMPLLVRHMSKMFLPMRRAAALLQTLETQRGTSRFWQPPDVRFDGGQRRKVITFFQHFSNKNMCLGSNRTFLHYLRLKKRCGGIESALLRVYMG
jgi:hypothetical protein